MSNTTGCVWLIYRWVPPVICDFSSADHASYSFKTFKKPLFRGTVRGIGVLYLQSRIVVYYKLYKLYNLLDCINFVFVTTPIYNKFQFFEFSRNKLDCTVLYSSKTIIIYCVQGVHNLSSAAPLSLHFLS